MLTAAHVSVMPSSMDSLASIVKSITNKMDADRSPGRGGYRAIWSTNLELTRQKEVRQQPCRSGHARGRMTSRRGAVYVCQ